MKKRILTAVIFILLSLLVLSGCGGKQETKQEGNVQNPATQETAKKELKTFNAGYLASPGHALYFVAKEKGYFAEEGLDVTLYLFNNSGEGMNAIISKKLDVGNFGTTAPLKFIANGQDLTIFGGQMEDGGSGMVAKPEVAAKLKDLKNLKGKKLAVVKLSTGDVVFRAGLMNAGVDWKKDMTVVEMDTPAAVMEAVKKGAADAGLVWAPHLKNAENQGLVVALYSDEVEDNHSCCRQVTLTSNLQEKPADYEKLLRALIKAYKFYSANQDETVDIIAKYVKVDKEIIKAETYGRHLISNPDPGKKASITFWNNMNRIGYVSSQLNIEHHLNIDLYKKALDSILQENPNDPVYLKMAEDYKTRNL